ncbi:MAG: response regulator transcription factor [Deltaproteobacteria bacterium]|nr:response regulator transcription factor [Deltaproteobacteria bacterium]
MNVVAHAQLVTVIVVEDEPVTRALISGTLRAAGFDVIGLATAAELRASGALDKADLVLLDIELPDGDGLELAAWLRQRSEAGIIFVSRRTATVDRVRGLELGGDDFIVKPPDVDELVARARAVLRRRRRGEPSAPPVHPAARVRFGGWIFDPSRFELTSPAGQPVPLTTGEAGVLSALARAGGQVVARAALQEMLAGEGGAAASRSLDVLVHRVRKKLGEGGAVVPRVLLTVHGVGYRLASEPEPA